VPGEGHGLGRAEAFDFLHDVIGQLKQQSLGREIFTGTQLPELRSQFEAILAEASQRFRREQIRTLIVIDGLDHVPREERPQESFLRELPLPHSIPEGVVFVFGTQHLHLPDLPPAIIDEAKGKERCVQVTPLLREAVTRLADFAGVPTDVNRDRLYARTEGHPLSTRYAIECLLQLDTLEARNGWLVNGPAYGGNVDVFYERAWRDLSGDLDAQRAIAHVALAEGPISPVALDGLVGEKATDAAWRAAGHLLVRDQRNSWSIFHNSFRLFLLTRASMRHGQLDPQLLQRRYAELAEMARNARAPDPQSWMELRYRARAGDHAAVAQLTTPQRFRGEFMAGRNPADIFSDMDLALLTVRILRRPDVLIDLILSRHEIIRRLDALGDEVFSAFIEIGDLQFALGFIDARISLTAGKAFELVDAFLARGELSEARKLFQKIEPIDRLLGSREIETRSDHHELEAWAERSLVFREPKQVVASIARLRQDENPFNSSNDLNACQIRLKLYAARGQLNRDPTLEITSLAESLEIHQNDTALLYYFSCRGAFDADLNNLVIERLREVQSFAADLSPDVRRDAAMMAAMSGRLDISNVLMDGLPPATIDAQSFEDDDLRHSVRQVIKHIALQSWLGRTFISERQSQSDLATTLSTRLEEVGQLLGDAYAKRQPHTDPILTIRKTLDFLEHAKGEEPHDSMRWRLDRIADEIVGTMTDMAGMFGRSTLTRLNEIMDERFSVASRCLGRSSVRRAYATAAYSYEYDAEAAKRRLAYQPGLERSPEEQVKEAAETAAALARFGQEDLARTILEEMHAQGLGYSRPAKKDAQYMIWRGLLARANSENPGGRLDRIRFFGRLLDGLSNTQGDGAGGRLVDVFLREAAQAGPSSARAAADLIDVSGLSNWTTIVSALTVGVAKRNAALAAASAIIFGRVSLAFSTAYDDSAYSELIALAPADQLDFIIRHAIACVEVDSLPANRIKFLEEIVSAATRRHPSCDTDALKRWRTELPAPKSGNSPEDPFFRAGSLQEIEQVLEQVDDSFSAYGAIQAFERLAPEAPYDVAKTLFDRTKILQESDRALEIIALAAIAADRRDDVPGYLERLAGISKDRGSWGDGWRGAAKLRYHKISVALIGDAARRAAFDAFVDDLRNRHESVEYILPELDSILELLSPRPTWAAAWLHLQAHLLEFREFRIGQDLHIDDEEGGDAHSLADILFRAFETTSSPLMTMARTAAIELAQAPNGTEVLRDLIPRLLQNQGIMALEASQIAWECKDVSAIRDVVKQTLRQMTDSMDVAVRRIAFTLAQRWDYNLEDSRQALSPIYKHRNAA
jgi:hypothetical protein